MKAALGLRFAATFFVVAFFVAIIFAPF